MGKELDLSDKDQKSRIKRNKQVIRLAFKWGVELPNTLCPGDSAPTSVLLAMLQGC